MFPQFLQDLISAVVQILASSGRLQGWNPDRMSDSCAGVRLLAEQMCSELKPTGENLTPANVTPPVGGAIYSSQGLLLWCVSSVSAEFGFVSPYPGCTCTWILL